MNLSNWIKEDLKAECSEDVKSHIKRLQEQINQMNEAMKDLLESSRVEQ